MRGVLEALDGLEAEGLEELQTERRGGGVGGEELRLWRVYLSAEDLEVVADEVVVDFLEGLPKEAALERGAVDGCRGGGRCGGCLRSMGGGLRGGGHCLPCGFEGGFLLFGGAFRLSGEGGEYLRGEG